MAGIVLLGLIATPVWAQEEEGDDFTMEVVRDADTDEAEYVEDIELPAAASDAARDNAAFGIDTANDARKNASEDGRAFGERTASEARERGRDAGKAASARDRAGDAGDRGNRP